MNPLFFKLLRLGKLARAIRMVTMSSVLLSLQKLGEKRRSRWVSPCGWFFLGLQIVLSPLDRNKLHSNPGGGDFVDFDPKGRIHQS